MPMIEANGANFYYELHGNGHPVVLISGYTCDNTFWATVVEDLSASFQVLVFDNRGVGQTKDDGGPLSDKLMAADVMALSKALNLEKPHIVGQSMGGTIAQTTAALYPDQINKLCLLNTSAKWRPAMLIAEKSLLRMNEKKLDFDLVFEAIIPWIFGTRFLENRDNIERVKQLMLDNPYPQSVKDQGRQCKVLESFNGLNQLKSIKAQTLVVFGTQDLISLPSESYYLADHIRTSKLVELDCAHGITLEVPQQLTNLLVDFLRK